MTIHLSQHLLHRSPNLPAQLDTTESTSAAFPTPLLAIHAKHPRSLTAQANVSAHGISNQMAIHAEFPDAPDILRKCLSTAAMAVTAREYPFRPVQDAFVQEANVPLHTSDALQVTNTTPKDSASRSAAGVKFPMAMEAALLASLR